MTNVLQTDHLLQVALLTETVRLMVLLTKDLLQHIANQDTDNSLIIIDNSQVHTTRTHLHIHRVVGRQAHNTVVAIRAIALLLANHLVLATHLLALIVVEVHLTVVVHTAEVVALHMVAVLLMVAALHMVAVLLTVAALHTVAVLLIEAVVLLHIAEALLTEVVAVGQEHLQEEDNTIISISHMSIAKACLSYAHGKK